MLCVLGKSVDLSRLRVLICEIRMVLSIFKLMWELNELSGLPEKGFCAPTIGHHQLSQQLWSVTDQSRPSYLLLWAQAPGVFQMQRTHSVWRRELPPLPTFKWIHIMFTKCQVPLKNYSKDYIHNIKVTIFISFKFTVIKYIYNVVYLPLVFFLLCK
jgi:hypothetical protein